MKISSLRMVNYRCFRDLTVTLHAGAGDEPGFTFLVAKNGVGKTTILSALSVALGSALLRLADLTPPDLSQRDARAEIVRSAAPPGGQAVVRREPNHPVRLVADGALLGETMRWARELRYKDSTHSTIKEATPLAEKLAATVARARAGEAVNLPVLAYFRTNRLWVRAPDDQDAEPAGPDSRFAAWRGCLDAGASWEETAKWWRRETVISRQKARPSLDAVRRVAGALGGGPDQPWFDLELNDVVAHLDGQLRQFSDLSDGQRAMMGLLADIARRAADLNPHLGADAPALTPGVVLIDEIDMHLHPAWQRQIVDLLRAQFPKMQFIVGTHAPQVLTDARPGEIRILRQRDGEQPEVLPLDIPPGMTADEVLTGPWYGLSTTTDDDTVGLIREQAELMRLTDPTPAQITRQEEITAALRKRLGGWNDTSEERIVRSILAEIEEEQPAFTQEDRARLKDLVLARLRSQTT